MVIANSHVQMKKSEVEPHNHDVCLTI